MTEQEAKQRFAGARVARLATVSAKSEPHLVPICFALDAENTTIYSAVDAKPKTTRDLKRLRNIEENPRVTLLVDHYDDDWAAVWWVRVDGTATLHDTHAHGRELLAQKYPQYRDDPDALGRMVVIDATKWASWAYSDPV
jgi:PPOX class probable F420-dependent enzyme